MHLDNRRFCLVLSLVALGLLAATEARAADPAVVGTWSWFSNIDVSLESNKTIHISGRKAGAWETGHFKYKGKTYKYKLIWDRGSDNKPHVDYLNLVEGNNKLQGVNTEGGEIWGQRK